MSQTAAGHKNCGHLKSHKTTIENVTTINKKISSTLLPLKALGQGASLLLLLASQK
jgi:hypothetical protein